MLTQISTELNMNIIDHVVKEVYQHNVELGHAKWIEGRSPMPHRGGGKSKKLEVRFVYACTLNPCLIT
jgi:hypothetical protein